jgi:hypothetical protein
MAKADFFIFTLQIIADRVIAGRAIADRGLPIGSRIFAARCKLPKIQVVSVKALPILTNWVNDTGGGFL